MEKKDNNIVEISSHRDFENFEEKLKENKKVKQNTKSTNPIAKQFAKFALRSKDKFSLKDIFK